MTLSRFVTEYDQALNTLGASEGLKFKEMANAYLLGIETGVWESSSVRVVDYGEPGFFCLTRLFSGSELVGLMRGKVNSSFANQPYQVALARIFQDLYPCPAH
jgi:hypothetical protein